MMILDSGLLFWGYPVCWHGSLFQTVIHRGWIHIDSVEALKAASWHDQSFILRVTNDPVVTICTGSSTLHCIFWDQFLRQTMLLVRS